MGATVILFWFLAAVAVSSALGIIISRKQLFSVLSFLLVIFSLAGHFILMNAQYLALVDIMVWGAAVGILFLYAVTLTRSHKDSEQVKIIYMRIAGVVAALALMVVLIAAVAHAEQNEVVMRPGTWVGHVNRIGKELFSRFYVPFIISSFLLLSTLTGIFILNKKESSDSKPVQL
ncbi:MAG: NADH-quinone oxidoreductase subunit J [Chitinophagaceae bacterium]|nr:NADH-quinone oxidoreductase subunit J [Chitinophagaceae bacterium]